jgi:non-homologous end joining protein Ku
MGSSNAPCTCPASWHYPHGHHHLTCASMQTARSKVAELLDNLERSVEEARAARDRKVAADAAKEAERDRTY